MTLRRIWSPTSSDSNRNWPCFASAPRIEAVPTGADPRRTAQPVVADASTIVVGLYVIRGGAAGRSTNGQGRRHHIDSSGWRRQPPSAASPRAPGVFTEYFNLRNLAAERRRVARWLVVVDVLMGVALGVDAIMLSKWPLTAVLTMALGS